MKDLLHHYFLPRPSNNYRARLLQEKILLFFILFFFSAGLAMSFVKTSFPSVLGISSDISNQQLLILTNQQRQNNSLPPLTDNSELDQAAANKASDMFAKDYWAHDAPDGTTPWSFIKAAGYNYVYAGENLARGFNSAQDVVNAWMASPEHRQNILSPHYQNVGFAVATGSLNGEETVLVVEMLGSTNFAPAPLAKELNKPSTVSVASGSPAVNTGNSTLGVQKTKPVTKTYQPTKIPAINVKPLVDSAAFSTLSAQLILALFIFVMILDMAIIEKKKIVRFVGHNFDHVLFLSLMLIVIIILARGAVI